MTDTNFPAPGKSLAHQVAEEVMGWHYRWTSYHKNPGDDCSLVASRGGWCPDTDIRKAWLVVEEMERRGWVIDMYRIPGSYRVRFKPNDNVLGGFLMDGDTAPLAICHAALAALRGE